MDEDIRNILDNIALENGYNSTSEFVRNKLIDIASEYIDVQEYKEIIDRIENGTEKLYSFEEAKDLII